MKKYTVIVLLILTLACSNSNKSNYKRLKYGTAYIDKFGNRTVNTTFSIKEKFSSAKAAELYTKALIFTQNQEIDSALIYLRLADKTEIGNKLILKDLGNVFGILNQLDSAKIYTKKSLLIDSTYALALNNYGLLLYREDSDKEAIRYYDKAILINSTNGLFYVNKALAYQQLGQMDSCCKLLKIARKINSYDSKEYIEELLKTYDCDNNN